MWNDYDSDDDPQSYSSVKFRIKEKQRAKEAMVEESSESTNSTNELLTVGDRGNNGDPIPPAKEKKKKYNYQYWDVVINNYTIDTMQLLPTLPNLLKYCYQEEIGESGNKHLQCVLCFNKPITLRQLQQCTLKAMSARPINSWINALAYCHKMETRNGKVFSNIPEVMSRVREQVYIDPRLDYYKIEEFLPWQKSLYNMTLVKPHKRQIWWIYDEAGCRGKSQFMRTLRITEKSRIICCTGGSEKDIVNMINNKVEEGMDLLVENLTIIIDIPRCKEVNDNVCVSYSLLENLKNGFCVNTKYKAKDFDFNPPHIIVLANWLPDFSQMTSDKLIEYNIVNDELIKP